MDRKTMIGIAAGSLVVVGLGIAGLRYAVAPDPDEAAGAAKLRALGERIQGGVPSNPTFPPAAPGVAPPGGPENPGAAGQPAVSTAAVAVPRLNVPPTKKGIRDEARRVARERAIARGKLPEFEASEKKIAEKEARKKAEREKRREAFKERVSERRKVVEAARKAGKAPPPPPGRPVSAQGTGATR